VGLLVLGRGGERLVEREGGVVEPAAVERDAGDRHQRGAAPGAGGRGGGGGAEQRLRVGAAARVERRFASA
jgi:hypothetical protein